MPEQSERRAILRGCRHILVIQDKNLGDTFWTIPFIESLRRNLPYVNLSLVVRQGNEFVFRDNPAVDRVIGFPFDGMKGWAGKKRLAGFLGEIRKLGADAVIDLTDGERGALISFFSGARHRFTYPLRNLLRHRLFNQVLGPRKQGHPVRCCGDLLELLGLVNCSDKVHFRVPGTALAALQKKAPLAFTDTGRRKVVIHPGARHSLRRWGACNYARLCDLLSERFEVFLVVGPEEREILDQVLETVQCPPRFASDSLSLAEFAALCSRADLFVGNDAGPIHVAAATGAFVFGLYGAGHDEYSEPCTEKRCVIEGHEPAGKTGGQGSFAERQRSCLDEITPEEVLESIEAAYPEAFQAPESLQCARLR